jgi:flagellar motor switch protein FliN/FliY
MAADDKTPDNNTPESKGSKDPSVDLPEFEDDSTSQNPLAEQEEDITKDISAVYDVPVQVSAVLGRASLQVNQLLKLSRGAVIELDRRVGEAIDIFVNNRLVARGEIVVVDDHLGITMTEIIKSDQSV